MESEKIVVLNARAYSFTKQGTNELIEGVKLAYIFGDSLVPNKIDSQQKGYLIAEGSIPMNCIGNINQVPGIYNAKFGKTVNAKSQVVHKLMDVEFVRPFAEDKQIAK